MFAGYIDLSAPPKLRYYDPRRISEAQFKKEGKKRRKLRDKFVPVYDGNANDLPLDKPANKSELL